MQKTTPPEPDLDPTIVLDEAEEASPSLELNLDEAPAEPGRLARGAEVIKTFWKHAPLGPGVYRMLGEGAEVLYVGKARSIRKRIIAYTTPERQSTRIARMVAQTTSMVFVTTETEAEALLLEANLIKQLKPRYNVLLRDDKSFPYILITGGHEAPQLLKHRGARTRRGSLSSAPIQICACTASLATTTMSVVVPATTFDWPTTKASFSPSEKSLYGSATRTSVNGK